MPNIFLYSDPHFGHAALVDAHNHGKPPRPFRDVAHMHECLISRHNEVVKPSDIVWCLGDFTLSGNPDVFRLYARWLHGRMGLVLGNHDQLEGQTYREYFEWVVSFKELDGMMLTHAPVAPWSMRWRANVHGHCHSARPLVYRASDPDVLGFQRGIPYVNVSVENINYRPVALEEVNRWLR